MVLSIRLASSQPGATSNVSQRTYQGQQGHTLLQLLCDHSPAMIEALEEKEDGGALLALLWASPRRDAFIHTHKLDVDCPNPDGEKLWLRAAKGKDYPNATRKLIWAGVNIRVRDEQGQEALSIMATRQHNKALSVMLDELSPPWENKERFSGTENETKSEVPQQAGLEDKRGAGGSGPEGL